MRLLGRLYHTVPCALCLESNRRMATHMLLPFYHTGPTTSTYAAGVSTSPSVSFREMTIRAFPNLPWDRKRMTTRLSVPPRRRKSRNMWNRKKERRSLFCRTTARTPGKRAWIHSQDDFVPECGSLISLAQLDGLLNVRYLEDYLISFTAVGDAICFTT